MCISLSAHRGSRELAACRIDQGRARPIMQSNDMVNAAEDDVRQRDVRLLDQGNYRFRVRVST